MTDDYTPSLNEVRADYVAIHTRNFDSYATGRSLTSEREVYASRFDRWLASHDADVATWDASVTRREAQSRAVALLSEAADRRSWVMQREDATDAEVLAADREFAEIVVDALAAAGLLTPSDTFASTKSSDAEHLLSVVETIKETGGSVQIRGVLITPCDTYGQPLTNVHPDADVAERIVRAIEETPWDRPGQPVVAPEHQAVWMNGVNEGIAFAARIARSHATPPVASTGEEADRG